MPIVQEIKVPLLAVNDTTLTIVEISFEHGQPVKKGDTILVFETSKTTYNVEAEMDGFVSYRCELGKDYEVEEIVANIFSDSSEVGPLHKSKSTVIEQLNQFKENVSDRGFEWSGETIFSKGALALINERKIDKAIFSGLDFVNKRDVEERIGISNFKNDKKPAESFVRVSSNQNKHDLNLVTLQDIPSAKRKEIEYLSEVQSTGLTSTVNTVIELEGVFTFLNQALKFLKSSLLPVIIYESSRLLKKYPLLNAYFGGDKLAVYKLVEIGFAVDLEKGLKVLKLPKSNSKSLGEIESELLQLSEKYLDDKLALEDLVGITFTITDLSAETVSFFRPLVNMYNSAILAISSIDGKLNRVVLSLTFDHRVTEGKYAAQFLKELKERIESYKGDPKSSVANEIECFRCMKKLSEDLSDTGFIKCITPNGTEGYICQSCIKGF